MNTSIDLKTDSAPLACGLPLSLLALVDLATLKRNYAQFLSEPPEQNRWFVQRGEEALPPQSFDEVLNRLARGEGPLAVLREAEAEQDPTPWSMLEHQASVSSRPTALAVIIGFWAVVVFLGWVPVAAFGPRAHSGLWQTAYFIVALAAIAALSIPSKAKRRRQF